MEDQNNTTPPQEPQATPDSETQPLPPLETVRETPKNIFEESAVTETTGYIDSNQNPPHNDLDTKKEYVAFLDVGSDETFYRMDNNIEVNRTDTPQARQWSSLVEAGLSSIPHGGQYASVTQRQGTEFRQYLNTDKGRMGFSAPKIAESGPMVSGQKAVLKLRHHLGMGGLISIPLWHSGFWITIRTPSESAMLELRRRIDDDRIRLGRSTHGLVFSNLSVYTNQYLLDLVIDHVYDTTLRDVTDLTELRDKILTTDLQVLFWGLAVAVWPRGFQFARSVMSTEGINQKTIVTGKVSPSKMMFVDNLAFTQWQKNHMANRASKSMTNDSIDRYRNEFSFSKGVSIELTEEVRVNLATPSAQSYITAGHRWVTEIASLVEQTYTSDREDIERRNEAVLDYANATLMRNYGHWIHSIDMHGETVTDRDTLDAMIDTLSEREDVREKFSTAVKKFMDEVTVALIAVPESSGKDTGLPRFPHLISIDVVSVFFILLMQRVNQIQERR